ncbi:helix-turn-helix transcriptional regulator [Kitasatospora paracochleata]|uniref:Tetratricopeptide (TPR) repeat protein n=1 Tax=Kitasatospora paracochleata TaxID=58354 RepID=A0ABT1J984_9ACTN|nr:helix-turn-helix domain-containing protein [Kitasatospora paracochleata]MCP2314020.1 tetratricopeptide (TPR) repeat protein [Kitasatospora paracochleata]
MTEPLPARVLTDPRFTDACAQRRIGQIFNLARTLAGVYPARIAQLTGLSTSRVTEYMQGGREVTSITVIERVADGLGIPGRMLGLADRAWESSALAVAHQPPQVPETWEILDLLTGSSASDATLTHLEAAVADTAYRYPSAGPAELLPTMHRQLAAVRTLIGRPQHLDARRRCVRILTVLSGLLGLAAHDLGHRTHCEEMFHLGKVAAREGEADELTAWLLTMESIVAYTSGRWQEAAALLGRADRLALTASPRRQAWIRANCGRALAACGDQPRALAALDQAAELLERAEEPIGGLDFFTTPRLDGLGGESQALLGRHDAAAELLGSALARRDAADVKGRAVLTFDLAECRLQQGDIDAACGLAQTAFDIAEGSVVQPLVLRAQAFQRSLGPWREARSVRALAVRVRESGAQLARM